VSCLAETAKRADRAMSGRKFFFSIGPILFLYYEESLVSSNLNSKLFRFSCVRPSQHINMGMTINFKFQIQFLP
jgi:hypothetical protein